MTFEEYLKQSEVTERKFVDGMKTEAEATEAVFALLNASTYMGLNLDLFKKVMIYGKPLGDIEAPMKELGTHYDALTRQKMFEDVSLELDQRRAETLHALMGMITEMAEITPSLVRYIFFNEPVDETNLAEEIGDLYWYLAILFRLFKLDNYEIMEKNIAKLAKRYPDKFSAYHALNRDLKAEREILES